MKKKSIFWIINVLSLVACESFLQIDPPRTEISSESIFSNAETAISAVKGIYSQMSFDNFASGDVNSVTYLAALSSDELVNFSNSQDKIEFSNNSLQSQNGAIFSLWAYPYKFINNANTLIEGLNSSSTIEQEAKNKLIGHALFVRAFCYFYLVNLFGDVPLVMSTDFEVNRSLSRSSKEQIYNQIIMDLEHAQDLLPDDYSFSNGERIEPNKWAVKALLARTYLYLEEWSKAENYATEVINKADLYYLEVDLSKVFLRNSAEAIWQLKPVMPNANTNEAKILTITETPPVNSSMTDQLISAFEANDNRMINWVDSISNGSDIWFYPAKYKVFEFDQPLTEYSMVLRLAEQYLIRAEARTHLSNIAGAQEDINAIRNRAGLPNTSSDDTSSLLMAIEQERRVELFVEWGHRWLDLKRTGNAESVLAPIKENWDSNDTTYPIPLSEIQNNPNLRME